MNLNTVYKWFGKYKEYLIIIILAFILTSALMVNIQLMTPDHPDFTKPWDHHKYIHMASNDPLDFHIAPFCWRILVPSLARMLPFNLQANFFLIAFSGVWLTGMVVYLLGRELFSSSLYGIMGMFLYFSSAFASKFMLYDFWLPDSIAYLFMVLGIYGILIKNDVLFLVSLLLGVLAKESVIFIVPLYYTLSTNSIIDLKILKKCILLSLPAVLLVILVRFFIPPLNNDPVYINRLPETLRQVQLNSSAYNYFDLFRLIGLPRLQNLSMEQIYIYTLGTFGVLLIFPLLAWKKIGQLFIRFLPFLLLVYAQLLFAVNTKRLLIFAFPVFLYMSLHGIKAFSSRFSVKPFWFILLLFLLTVFNIVYPGYFPITAFIIQFCVFFLYLSILFILKKFDIVV